jgi:hypothetical protein
VFLQITTYILIGLAAITNLWVGYERQFFYINYVFPSAKWPRFSGINNAVANPQYAKWHTRLRRFKKLLLAAYILPVCIAILIILQVITAK